MTSEDGESLGTALPKRMKEIREVYIPAYQSVGSVGSIAVGMMNADLTRAEKAMMEGDLVGMIQAYKSLCEYKL